MTKSYSPRQYTYFPESSSSQDQFASSMASIWLQISEVGLRKAITKTCNMQWHTYVRMPS